MEERYDPQESVEGPDTQEAPAHAARDDDIHDVPHKERERKSHKKERKKEHKKKDRKRDRSRDRSHHREKRRHHRKSSRSRSSGSPRDHGNDRSSDDPRRDLREERHGRKHYSSERHGSRDTNGDSRRDRSERRGRSAERRDYRYDRDRSDGRGGSDDRRRGRSPDDRRGGSTYVRGPSPATARARTEQREAFPNQDSTIAAVEEKEPAKPKRFWDGFQWVDQHPNRLNDPLSGEASLHAVTQQTRQERRLYVGNLTPGVTTGQLSEFLNKCMDTCLTGAGAKLPDQYTQSVLSVWIGPSTNYAFVEFVTKECATIAIGLSGIEFMGAPLKISRPNNYANSQTNSSALASQALTSALMGGAMGGTVPALTQGAMAGAVPGLTQEEMQLINMTQPGAFP